MSGGWYFPNWVVDNKEAWLGNHNHVISKHTFDQDAATSPNLIIQINLKLFSTDPLQTPPVLLICQSFWVCRNVKA